ncbi:MAG: FtsX-like permease family protein [Bacillota bacterium]
MAKSGGLFSLAIRFLKALRLRTLLAVVSVVLGVGLLSALLTLNSTMEASVEAYLAKVYGSFDVMAGYRKPGLRLSEADLELIRRQPGVRDAAGVLIPYMQESHPELAGLRLNYYGTPDTPLGRQFLGSLKEGSFPGPGQAALSEAWARKAGLKVGDSLELPFPPSGSRRVSISGLLSVPNELSVGIALFERTWLEGATSRPGATFSMVMIEKGTDLHRLTNALRSQLPELEVDQRKFLDEARENLNAMRPVALGMGVAALLAAAFLLTGAFRMSLAERTQELAMLRAIGAAPGQIRRLLLAEGLLVGAAGSTAGALLGAGAAAASSGLVARLMQTEPVPPVLPWPLLALAALAGTLLSLLAALGVARAAGRTEPLRAMRPDLPTQEQEARQGGRFGLVLIGLGVPALAAGALLPIQGDGLRALLGSTGGLAVAVGLLLGLQRFLPVLIPLLALPLRRRTEGPLAVRSLLRHRRRSSNTVGAMGLGLVLVVAISTLASSLLGNWYQQVRAEHPADFQLEVPRLYERGVSAELAQEVASIPGVTEVAEVGQGIHVLIADWDWSRADPAFLREAERWNSRYWKGYESLYVQFADLPALARMGAYRVLEGSLEDWGPTAIAFTRSRAEQLGVRAGDRLQLNLSQAPVSQRASNPRLVTYTVAAILEESSYKFPWVIVGAPIDPTAESLTALYGLADPAQREAVRRQVEALTRSLAYSIAEYSDFEMATARLRAQINQRFALLLAAAAVMAAVAVMSLVNTMISSIAERRREFALLRSIGATPAQVWTQVLIEAALLGLVGGIVGVTGGAVLGTAALTGLDLPLAEVRLPWAVMGLGLLASVALACAAALAPARRAAGLVPAEAVRTS